MLPARRRDLTSGARRRGPPRGAVTRAPKRAPPRPSARVKSPTGSRTRRRPRVAGARALRRRRAAASLHAHNSARAEIVEDRRGRGRVACMCVGERRVRMCPSAGRGGVAWPFRHDGAANPVRVGASGQEPRARLRAAARARRASTRAPAIRRRRDGDFRPTGETASRTREDRDDPVSASLMFRKPVATRMLFELKRFHFARW